MSLTLNTLNQLEALLTSERITYRGSEIQALGDILKEVARERAEVTKALRVVSNNVNNALQGAVGE
jgi:hypothetical protein